MTVAPRKANRAYWLKTLHKWHWISSAVCLLGVLLFSVTGITLNHSEQLDSLPAIGEAKAIAPSELLQNLAALGTAAEEQKSRPATPAELVTWVRDTFGADVSNANSEWSARELYLSMQRPGGDSWVSIGLRDGATRYQTTDRGWIAYLNDLHKGRYAGPVWAWFIDVVAVACLLFAITGLFILKMHAVNRPATWPLLGFGILVPLLIALLFIH